MAELKKTLGLGSIIALILTSLVGTGMFLGTSIGASYSGNGVLIAWLILIAISVYVAAAFGELIALFPTAGGLYEFSKQAYGRFFSFMICWTTWIMSNLTITVMIVAALQYLLPPGYDETYKVLIACGLILLFNFISYLGVDISASILTVFAFETVALFLAIIFPGFLKIDTSNLVPLVSGDYTLVFVSLFFMLEALMGWEAASFLSEETKDAAKVIPKALVITTFMAGLLGLGLAFVSLGIIPAAQLAHSSAPATDVASHLLGDAGARWIGIGVVLALFGSVVGAVISTPRLLLAMARDKIFISQLAAIHPKRRTPYKAIIFQTIVSLLLIFVGFGQYKLLLEMFTPLALIVYVLILLTVPILRFTIPQAKREFKVPFGRIGPIIVSLLYLGVIAVWLISEPNAWKILKLMLSIVSFGMPIYLMMIFFYNPDAIAGFMNTFSRVNLWLENFLLPKRIRWKLLEWMHEPLDKDILDYGAGVGTMTLPLATAVGPRGKVYATDLSRKNIRILKSRLDKRNLKNVVLINDEHQVNRVHPSVNGVDMVFSVGFLSYMQDVGKILKEMHRLLPESGRICFLEYVRFFHILPDKEWLTDHEKLKKIFRDAGFSVKIEKKNGILWSYLFIYGIKSSKDVPIV